MVLDGLRGYLQLANGLTDVTRDRARAAARALVAQGEAGVGAVLPGGVRAQVSGLTEDLIATSKANRDLLVGLVRVEVERTVARLGLVSAAELQAATLRAQALEDRVHELERALRAESAAPSEDEGARGRTAARKTTPKKASGRKTAAKKTAAKKTAAAKAAAAKP